MIDELSINATFVHSVIDWFFVHFVYRPSETLALRTTIDTVLLQSYFRRFIREV